MRWDHIKDDQITVMQGKTDKGLTILLTDRLKAYLASIRKTGLTIVTDANGAPAIYRTIAQEMRVVKGKMRHPDARRYVTHGLRKNATIELYQAGNRDELVKAVTGHSSTEMLKKYGGAVRQVSFAREAQEARNRAEQNKDRT
jgi:integrase